MTKKLRYPVIVLIIAIDQLVKYAVRINFAAGEGKDIIKNFFSITYIQNKGAAFSILDGQGIIISIITGIAMIIMILYMEVNKSHGSLMIVSICMLIGGGMGNLIDRLVLGYVTDMFDFHFWPVFNVADIFVVCGCFLLCIYVLKSDSDREKTEKNRLI